MSSTHRSARHERQPRLMFAHRDAIQGLEHAVELHHPVDPNGVFQAQEAFGQCFGIYSKTLKVVEISIAKVMVSLRVGHGISQCERRTQFARPVVASLCEQVQAIGKQLLKPGIDVALQVFDRIRETEFDALELRDGFAERTSQ